MGLERSRRVNEDRQEENIVLLPVFFAFRLIDDCIYMFFGHKRKHHTTIKFVLLFRRIVLLSVIAICANVRVDMLTLVVMTNIIIVKSNNTLLKSALPL